MTTAGLRSAQAAIDGARAAIERLDEGRHAEENAADLIEAWSGAEAALRGLIGKSSLEGHPLIREARQRNFLTLDQAHALVEFSAAAERARDAAYEPIGSDLTAALGGFHLLESALSRSPDPEPRAAAPPNSVILDSAMSPLPAPTPSRVNWLGRGMAIGVILLALVVLGAGAFYVWEYRNRVGAMQRAIAAYAAGDRFTAKREFALAAEKNPKLAEPHIYLGRIAREEGDAATAARELNTAVTLEPESPLALREMAAHLLALGNLDLARRFYVRAVTRAPNDRLALGYLACTLARQGRFAEAQRFLQRAGPGEWSGCVQAAVPLAPPPQ